MGYLTVTGQEFNFPGRLFIRCYLEFSLLFILYSYMLNSARLYPLIRISAEQRLLITSPLNIGSREDAITRIPESTDILCSNLRFYIDNCRYNFLS